MRIPTAAQIEAYERTMAEHRDSIKAHELAMARFLDCFPDRTLPAWIDDGSLDSLSRHHESGWIFKVDLIELSVIGEHIFWRRGERLDINDGWELCSRERGDERVMYIITFDPEPHCTVFEARVSADGKVEVITDCDPTSLSPKDFLYPGNPSRPRWMEESAE